MDILVCSLGVRLNLSEEEAELDVLYLLFIFLFEHGDGELVFGFDFELPLLEFLQPAVFFGQFALQIEVLVEDEEGVAPQEIHISQDTRQQRFLLPFLAYALHLPHLPRQVADVGQRISPEISDHPN